MIIWGKETEPLFSLSLCVFSFFSIYCVHLGFFLFFTGANVPSAPPPSESASATVYIHTLKFSSNETIDLFRACTYIHACTKIIFDEIYRYCECIYKGDFVSLCFFRILFCGLFLPIFFSVAPPLIQPPTPISTHCSCCCHALIHPNRRNKFITRRRDLFTPVVYSEKYSTWNSESTLISAVYHVVLVSWIGSVWMWDRIERSVNTWLVVFWSKEV